MLQDSMLGPLLFIIYINDLEDWLQTDKLQIYADDTVVYAEGKTEEEVVDKLNTMLECTQCVTFGGQQEAFMLLRIWELFLWCTN